MSQPIPVETSPEGLQLLRQLLEIAKRAHQPNPNPVDIKIQLSELNLDMLTTTLQQVKDVMHNYDIPLLPVKN